MTRSGSTTAKAAKVLTADTFPMPHFASEEDIEEICTQQRFDNQKRVRLTEYLQELVSMIRDIRNDPSNTISPKDRAEKQAQLKESLSDVMKSIKKLDRKSQNDLNKKIASQFCHLISAEGLSKTFADFQLPELPKQSDVPAPHLQRRCVRNEYEEYQSDCLDAVRNHMRYHGIEVIKVILQELSVALNKMEKAYVLSPDFKGGKKPLLLRENILINLLNIYSELSGKITKTCKSDDLIVFCGSVCDAIGVPVDGVPAALPRAYKKWQNHLNNN